MERELEELSLPPAAVECLVEIGVVSAADFALYLDSDNQQRAFAEAMQVPQADVTRAVEQARRALPDGALDVARNSPDVPRAFGVLPPETSDPQNDEHDQQRGAS